MVSQFGSLGYTIKGKTADLTVVQKTITWRFSTAWYGSARLGSAHYGTARLSSGRFAFPPQFSTALDWAGLFTCR